MMATSELTGRSGALVRHGQVGFGVMSLAQRRSLPKSEGIARCFSNLAARACNKALDLKRFRMIATVVVM